MDSDARARKDFINEMVNKSHHAGKIYRLPAVHKLKEPMTKMRLKAWTTSFLALFDETQQVNVKHTMFLWRDEDNFSDDAVRNGIPGSAEDVRWLFRNSRILKQDFTPELTTQEMQIIEDAETIDFPENYNTAATTPCSKCSMKHHGSCASVIAVYNKIVDKITGGQMKTAFKLFEGGPNLPNKNRENLAYMRKMIENFKSNMSNYINMDLLAPFEDGQYHTWKILIQAIYRQYNIEETQENMAQLFHSIKEAASSNKSTETKIGNLREILRRVQIKGKENYFISRDHEHGREVQTVDEQYTPQVNLLLSYIIVEEKVEEQKWNELQLAFERKIESGWSYQKWHQKRPELYKLIDTMQKPQSSRGALCSIESRIENIPEGEQNEEPVEEILEKLQLEINQIRRGQWQNSNRYKSGSSPGYRKEANGHQSSNWKSARQFGAQNGNSRAQICPHCTHHSGVAVYHTRKPEVYGGPECAFDKNGTKKGNSSFNNSVAMIEGANDANNGGDDADELRNYYKERLAALSDIPNDE